MKILQSVLLLLIIIVVAISSILLYNPTLVDNEQKIILNTKEKTDEKAVLKLLENIAENEKKEATSKIKREIKAKQKALNKPKSIIKEIYDGKVLYMKRCKLCHGGEKVFISKFSKDRWSNVLNKNSKILLKAHDKNNILKIAKNYFRTKEYELERDSLKKHIIDY